MIGILTKFLIGLAAVGVVISIPIIMSLVIGAEITAALFFIVPFTALILSFIYLTGDIIVDEWKWRR